jgi:hypothetical protein
VSAGDLEEAHRLAELDDEPEVLEVLVGWARLAAAGEPPSLFLAPHGR